MRPWLIALIIGVLMTILGSWLRGIRPEVRPVKRRPVVEEDDDDSPVPKAVPAPRKRPPPLPSKRARRAEPVATVVPAPEPRTPAAPVVAAAPILVEAKAEPRLFAAAQLAAFLGDRKTLRAAVLLQEVLGPPRCRRPTVPRVPHQPESPGT